MIIRLSLSLAAKSTLCYDKLRNSKCLILPSSRTLRDYKNIIRPKAGFKKTFIDESIKKASHLMENQRYMSFIVDEQQNLVSDRYTYQLIGYVDLGDPQLNSSTPGNLYFLLSHLRGILFDFEFARAYFAKKSVSSYQIFPLLWDAVAILKDTCNLKVITVVSDGASPNRKL